MIICSGGVTFEHKISVYIYICQRWLQDKTTILFLMLGNDSLYFAIIPLTPSATRTIILGSPKDSPRFGQKRKITIHCYYSPVTIHPSLGKNYRTVRDGGNPTKMAVATNNIMQVMNIILKLLVIESKIEHLQ